MGENGGINFRNWRLLPSQPTGLKNLLDLQLMPSMEEKPFFGVGSSDLQFNHPQQQLPHQLHQTFMAASMIGGPYHHHRVGGISDSPMPINYLMDVCFNDHQEKSFSLSTGYQHQQSELDYGAMSENPLNHPVQLIQQGNLWNNDNVSTNEVQVYKETDVVGPGNKRGSGGKAPKSTKVKKPKKDPKAPREDCSRAVNRVRAPKKSAEVIINGISMNISGIAVPVCSCTGTPQQCYRWGAGGWQSACCTTSLSMYPLPMSTKRRGARIPGRKMSFGAFRKVLEKLASEGYDFCNPIDLGTHWAKHGTNKFVTIR